jgi:N6-adenosine-specific RNA methylase IME4
MLNNQMGRRNLNTDQLSIIRGKLYNLYKSSHGGDRKSKGKFFPLKNTAEEMADKFKVSDRTIKNDAKFVRDHPEEAEKVLNGEKKKKDVIKEKRREAIKNSESKLPAGAVDIYNTTNKYRVIYADPPWSYHNKTTGTMPQDHYKLMTLEDICNMPIKNVSEDNAVLFLWVVVPQIEEALQVIKAWGFKYKTHFVWDKIKHNLGHYSSVRHELLFICTKGSCQPDNVKLFDSVYSEERTEHSKKPEYFRNLIDTLYLGNKIELFARSKNKGWDFYGNEVV